MNSKLNVEQRRARMLQLLTIRATKEQIVEQLKREGFTMSSSRTYDRDLAALKDKANEWIETFAQRGLAEHYQRFVLSLEERIRRLAIAEVEATRPADKIAANLAIKEVEVDLMELLLQGPVVWAAKRKAEKQPVSIPPVQNPP